MPNIILLVVEAFLVGFARLHRAWDRLLVLLPVFWHDSAPREMTLASSARGRRGAEHVQSN